jgi:hypothetical protein
VISNGVVNLSPRGSRLLASDAALYPLFTDEVVALMRRLIPGDRQGAVAVAVIAKARRAHEG